MPFRFFAKKKKSDGKVVYRDRIVRQFPEWITDKAPEVEGKYLVTYKGEVRVSSYNIKSGKWQVGPVEAWMEKPEAFKSE